MKSRRLVTVCCVGNKTFLLKSSWSVWKCRIKISASRKKETKFCKWNMKGKWLWEVKRRIYCLGDWGGHTVTGEGLGAHEESRCRFREFGGVRGSRKKLKTKKLNAVIRVLLCDQKHFFPYVLCLLSQILFCTY